MGATNSNIPSKLSSSPILGCMICPKVTVRSVVVVWVMGYVVNPIAVDVVVVTALTVVKVPCGNTIVVGPIIVIVLDVNDREIDVEVVNVVVVVAVVDVLVVVLVEVAVVSVSTDR